MLRVVLDTNVLVSATLVKEGAPNRIIQAWKKGEVELITSPVLLEELEEVLRRPRIQKYQWMAKEEVEEPVELLKDTAFQTSGRKLVTAVPEDPEDDFVISAALEGKADYIVSGDEHLLNLEKWGEIAILPPREFLELLRKGGPQKGTKEALPRLKHSIATHLLEAGANIIFVKDWLGHKNIQNTLVYARLTDGRRDEAGYRPSGARSSRLFNVPGVKAKAGRA